MKVVLGYPSLDTAGKGLLHISQNRQSKHTSVAEEAAIFPCVMAWAATMLKRDGHEVLWQDGPAEAKPWATQLQDLRDFRPDLVVWEVKTPSAKGAYEAVKRLKEALPNAIMVLVGDHVTALPEEALEATRSPDSGVVAITGGDYDFALQWLVKELVRKRIGTQFGPLPGELHMGQLDKAPGKNEAILRFKTESSLTTLPTIDRELCKWKLYSRMGNYLYRPGTHGYSARDCWWRKDGGCTFCSWTNTFKNYRQLSVDQFMADVESAHALGAREYFDDAGTWAPPGQWFEKTIVSLSHFNMGARYRRARMAIGCNDRPGARRLEHYRAMSSAGFRFILFGLESANLVTLQKINKGQHAEDMRNAAKWASEAGLQPHLTVMFGYPWESQNDATRTVEFVRDLFNKGWANSMQATLLMPYPGTRLFQEAEQNGWLLTKDWNRYTMNECILKCPMNHEEVLEKIRDCYKAAVTPRYILRKVYSIQTRDDLRFFWRGFRFWYGHLTDFHWR